MTSKKKISDPIADIEKMIAATQSKLDKARAQKLKAAEKLYASLSKKFIAAQTKHKKLQEKSRTDASNARVTQTRAAIARAQKSKTAVSQHAQVLASIRADFDKAKIDLKTITENLNQINAIARESEKAIRAINSKKTIKRKTLKPASNNQKPATQKTKKESEVQPKPQKAPAEKAVVKKPYRKKAIRKTSTPATKKTTTIDKAKPASTTDSANPSTTLNNETLTKAENNASLYEKPIVTPSGDNSASLTAFPSEIEEQPEAKVIPEVRDHKVENTERHEDGASSTEVDTPKPASLFE